MLLPWMISGGIGGTGIWWITAYVAFALFFSGIRAGSFWLGLTAVASITINVLQYLNVIPGYYDTLSLANFYFMSVIVYLLVFVFTWSRDQLDDELQSSTEVLKKVQSLTNIGSWTWDIKSDHLEWSDELYKVFNVKNGKNMNYKEYIKCVHPTDRSLVDTAMQKTMKNSLPFAVDHKIANPVGKKDVWVHSEGHAVLDDKNHVVEVIGTIQEVTSRKTAEIAAENRAEEMESVNKFMINREVKMSELKERIKELEVELNKTRSVK